MQNSEPTFLADRMLGRLSKWLRIMGLDCAYIREESFHNIVEQALREDRILLSRDTRIFTYGRIGRYLYIESNHLEYQLLQILAVYNIDPWSKAFCRCIVCNSLLKTTTFERAGARVPVHVKDTQATIASCPSCNRLYWGATHKSRMKAKLQRLTALSQKPTR